MSRTEPTYEEGNQAPSTNGWNQSSDWLRRLDWPALIIGLLAGLALGLLIGWQLWPVQWRNAWPSDLSPEAKAHYLAAVAEAYTYYGDEAAIETARQRLFDLQDNMEEEIAAARAYFQENPVPDSTLYINRLDQLASAMAVQSSTEPSVEAQPSTGALPGWLLLLLVVIAVVGAGLYWRSQRRQAPSSLNDEQYDGAYAPDTQPMTGSGEAWGASSASTRSHVPGGAATASGAGAFAPDDDYSFTEEPDDEPPLTGVVTHTPPDEAVSDEEEFYSMEDEEGDTASSALDVTAQAAVLRESPVAYQASEPVLSVAPVAAPKPKPGTRAVPQQGRVLVSHTAQYQIGMPDYDESYNIVDPSRDKYIGECGMGVNIKNDILQNHPDNVIALDVWLFDKTDEKNVGAQTRVLLSEYVIDNKLEQAFTKEKPNDPPPVVAQPGLRFQLKGQSLLLDCEVVEATYSKSASMAGIFQSVKVNMTVHLREH